MSKGTEKLARLPGRGPQLPALKPLALLVREATAVQGAFRNEQRPCSEASNGAFQGSGSTDSDHLRPMPDLRHGNSLLYTGIQDRNLGPINRSICSGFNELKSLDNSLLFPFSFSFFVLGTSLLSKSFHAITAAL